MNLDIKNEISAAGGKAQYDARAKRLLSNKYILAYILQEAVAEFKNESVQTIVECIENDIQISSVSVEPGETNSTRVTENDKMADEESYEEGSTGEVISGERITGDNTEDNVPDEGTIYFDLMFSAWLPKKKAEKGKDKDKTRLKIIVNVEAQKQNPSAYRLANRAIYYACRMISSQKTREFGGSDYNGIKRVYSIWICMNMPGDSLHCMYLVDECAFGEAKLMGGTDLLNIMFVELAEEMPDAQTEHRLHRLLGALFSEQMAARQKLEIMNGEYAIPSERGLKEEVNIMCNLGEGIEERALERGIKRGRAEGREEGRAEGRKETLLALIKKKVDKGKSLEQIADELEETQEVILPLYNQLMAE